MQQPPALHTNPLEDGHGSHLECSFFTADITLLGSYDAFPDTGSKITILTKSAINNLPLMPWAREPLAIVGGSSVHPEGTACLKITVDPITALVEAVVISNNVLAVILGEDWFRASNTRLVFEPPNPAEIHHLASGTVIQAHQKLYPHASCALKVLKGHVQTVSRKHLSQEWSTFGSLCAKACQNKPLLHQKVQ
ncbi:hypothetical protein HPB49_014390 [Dermacentor silvarum]|uniref:Uncharacterized protein n=1 Tax=Dermacentor silvarum TaxID=543639 RepID=A0ACB8DJ48_DERSI|nr:hypothetical protein HPB49_014390 [Dermacentor silvarum]